MQRLKRTGPSKFTKGDRQLDTRQLNEWNQKCHIPNRGRQDVPLQDPTEHRKWKGTPGFRATDPKKLFLSLGRHSCWSTVSQARMWCGSGPPWRMLWLQRITPVKGRWLSGQRDSFKHQRKDLEFWERIHKCRPLLFSYLTLQESTLLVRGGCLILF